MARTVSTAIVGAGFGGIAAAVNLRRQGQDDITILERGDSIGGVWRANIYPGLACDVPSHLYSLSFAPNPRWSRRFSQRAEIQAYLQDVAHRFDLERHIRLNSDVIRAEWDEARGRWQLEIGTGDTVEAEVLITACGQLTRPSIPDIPGLGEFKGQVFHSAHWPGDDMLEGRRVAVIGTGASAIQFVPAIAPQVAHMTVFQRTPGWVVPKSDKPYSQRTRRIYERAPWLQKAARGAMWALMEATVPVFTQRPRWAARAARLPFRGLSEFQRLTQLRGDRRLLEATKPDYPLGCKRLLLTSEWYPTLRRDNVDLVTDRVGAITADAVIDTQGNRYEADTIVFGTGFTATEFLAPMEVLGRDGLELTDAWRDGAEAYFGITVPGFPNMFLLYGPNTNHGTGSALNLIETQAGYASDAVQMISTAAAQRLEVRPEVHEAFQYELGERLRDSVWVSCSSWYVTESGRVTNNWPGSQAEYQRRAGRLNPADYLTEAPLPEPATA
jgi:cation diffusion facilitator CzcD-associated flavoprotein CzcO